MHRAILSRQSIGLSLMGAFFLTENSPAQNLFGSKKQENPLRTKTFIWGNGIYQPRPDAKLQFNNFEPKLISTFQGKDKINMREIQFGEYNEAGIDVNGYVYIWTKAVVEGNFANPATDNSRFDVVQLDKKNNNYVQVLISKGHVWALNTKGEVFSWSIQKNTDERNRVVSTKIDPSSQRQIKSLPPKIKQIATGFDHFLALTEQGDVFSMGDDTNGQCGLGVLSRSSAPPFYERRVKNPRKVEGLHARVTKVACGANHSLAITSEGHLYGWGSNSNMQLSQEDQFSKAEEPVLSIYSPLQLTKMLDLSIVTDVAAGEEHTVIVTENKNSGETEVFACGHNNKGELGAGYLKHLSDIVKLEGLSNFQVKNQAGEKENVRVSKISCGNHHCIAQLSAGVLTEWGENDYGQLGNKKRSFSEHPLMISTFKKQNILNISAGWNSSSVICEDLEDISSKTQTS